MAGASAMKGKEESLDTRSAPQADKKRKGAWQETDFIGPKKITLKDELKMRAALHKQYQGESERTSIWEIWNKEDSKEAAKILGRDGYELDKTQIWDALALLTEVRKTGRNSLMEEDSTAGKELLETLKFGWNFKPDKKLQEIVSSDNSDAMYDMACLATILDFYTLVKEGAKTPGIIMEKIADALWKLDKGESVVSVWADLVVDIAKTLFSDGFGDLFKSMSEAKDIKKLITTLRDPNCEWYEIKFPYYYEK